MAPVVRLAPLLVLAPLFAGCLGTAYVSDPSHRMFGIEVDSIEPWPFPSTAGAIVWTLSHAENISMALRLDASAPGPAPSAIVLALYLPDGKTVVPSTIQAHEWDWAPSPHARAGGIQYGDPFRFAPAEHRGLEAVFTSEREARMVVAWANLAEGSTLLLGFRTGTQARIVATSESAEAFTSADMSGGAAAGNENLGLAALDAIQFPADGHDLFGSVEMIAPLGPMTVTVRDAEGERAEDFFPARTPHVHLVYTSAGTTRIGMQDASADSTRVLGLAAWLPSGALPDRRWDRLDESN